MKKIVMHRFLAVLLFICCTSTLVLSQHVDVHWKRGTSFAHFKTYAWEKSPRPLNDSLWDQRIVDAIDRALAGKGMRTVESAETPDLIVMYFAGVKEEFITRYAYDWSSEVSERIGTLTVDVADPSKKEILWRGKVKDALNDRSERNVGKLNKMVSKMFKKFPPAN